MRYVACGRTKRGGKGVITEALCQSPGGVKYRQPLPATGRHSEIIKKGVLVKAKGLKGGGNEQLHRHGESISRRGGG